MDPQQQFPNPGGVFPNNNSMVLRRYFLQWQSKCGVRCTTTGSSSAKKRLATTREYSYLQSTFSATRHSCTTNDADVLSDVWLQHIPSVPQSTFQALLPYPGQSSPTSLFPNLQTSPFSSYQQPTAYFNQPLSSSSSLQPQTSL